MIWDVKESADLASTALLGGAFQRQMVASKKLEKMIRVAMSSMGQIWNQQSRGYM